MEDYLSIASSNNICMHNAELRDFFNDTAFFFQELFIIVSTFLTNHCLVDLFSVYFSLLCHRFMLLPEKCLWIVWKCYCKSFLYVNLNLAKMLLKYCLISLKCLISIIVTLKKITWNPSTVFLLQTTVFICWLLLQNKHIFSKHKQTSSAVFVSSCSC